MFKCTKSFNPYVEKGEMFVRIVLMEIIKKANGLEENLDITIKKVGGIFSVKKRRDITIRININIALKKILIFNYYDT